MEALSNSFQLPKIKKSCEIETEMIFSRQNSIEDSVMAVKVALVVKSRKKYT